jgi:hypothetical protein
LCNDSYIMILNKILTTSITSLISVIVLMVAITNPVIALAVNQLAYPPESNKMVKDSIILVFSPTKLSELVNYG